MKFLTYVLTSLLVLTSVQAANTAVMPDIRFINAQEDSASLYAEFLPVHLNVDQGVISAYQKIPAANTIQVETPSLTQNLDVRIRNNKYFSIINLPERIWILQDDYKNVQFGYTKIRALNLDSGNITINFDGTPIFANLTYTEEPTSVQLIAGRHDVSVYDGDSMIANFPNQLFFDRAIYTIFYLNGQVIIKKDYQLWQK